jgi:succinylarginine dihydrolase
MTAAYEVNFDGIVGPTHHYAGLSLGNVASMTHAQMPSNPREAALEGLAKMWLLAQRGIKQAVLPPHERPSMAALHQLGFRGSDAEILTTAAREAPRLLAACSSAASMWAANSATISPSADSADGKVHITAANLVNTLHRSLESQHTANLLQQIFDNAKYFVHHAPLAPALTLGDEGSANHTRLATTHGDPGIQLFVYGKHGLGEQNRAPRRFPARQTAEASQAIARLHLLNPGRLVLAQQHPDAIDAGVFHNDVISVGNGSVFLYHERAFVDTAATIAQLKCAAEQVRCTLQLIPVTEEQLSLSDAVATYLFNSQIVTLPDGTMLMLIPQECQRQRLCEEILGGNYPIKEIVPVDLSQSMRNGGGPGCLRLRVVLTEEELAAVKPTVFLTERLYQALVSWVKKFYRDRLQSADLADPQLLDESRQALQALHTLLKLV